MLAIPDYPDYDDSIEILTDEAEIVEKKARVSRNENKENLGNVTEANLEHVIEANLVEAKSVEAKSVETKTVETKTSTTLALANVTRKILGESTSMTEAEASTSQPSRDMTILLGQRNVLMASFLDSFRADAELLKEQMKKN